MECSPEARLTSLCALASAPVLSCLQWRNAGRALHATVPPPAAPSAVPHDVGRLAARHAWPPHVHWFPTDYHCVHPNDGPIVELADIVLDDRDFSLCVCVTRGPRPRTGFANSTGGSGGYGMLVAKDRSCAGDHQFRWAIHASGRVALETNGVLSNVGRRGPTPDSTDPNGFSSILTTRQPLVPNVPTHLALTRRDHLYTMYVNGVEDVSFRDTSHCRHHNALALRLGTRHPPAHSPHAVADPFVGSLTHACFVEAAMSADAIAAGATACLTALVAPLRIHQAR